ncbi:hypothetical protein ACFTY8_19820 [Streptomyces mirabilis]|uniref:hypothetical protein n=1 Tax=Streptomyces mirabilis TaxID=68239 RepID=UPI003626B6E5
MPGTPCRAAARGRRIRTQARKASRSASSPIDRVHARNSDAEDHGTGRIPGQTRDRHGARRWSWPANAVTASLGANVATAGLLDLDQVPAWLRILVAGWPAVAFLGGTLLAHSTPAPHEDTEDQDDQADAPDPAPELPAQPALEPTPAPPAVAVPAALVEHARKVAAEHHTRTGTAIDTLTLRARLGVPAPMADAIAAHL